MIRLSSRRPSYGWNLEKRDEKSLHYPRCKWTGEFVATWRVDQKAAQYRQTRETDEANRVVIAIELTAYHWLDGFNQLRNLFIYTGGMCLSSIALFWHVVVWLAAGIIIRTIENSIMGGGSVGCSLAWTCMWVYLPSWSWLVFSKSFPTKDLSYFPRVHQNTNTDWVFIIECS